MLERGEVDVALSDFSLTYERAQVSCNTYVHGDNKFKVSIKYKIVGGGNLARKVGTLLAFPGGVLLARVGPCSFGWDQGKSLLPITMYLNFEVRLDFFPLIRTAPMFNVEEE